jgi:hypothetical protein
MQNKEVFKFNEINAESMALSLGLASAPIITFV